MHGLYQGGRGGLGGCGSNPQWHINRKGVDQRRVNRRGQHHPGSTTGTRFTGVARYAADLKMPGVLHAKVLRSKVHHANIISIDTSAAEAVPGVEAVVTAKDIPGSPVMINAKPQRFLFPEDKIRFMGEALAAVAAESEEAAEEALSKIVIEYEELPPILDFRKADDPYAPLINPP